MTITQSVLSYLKEHLGIGEGSKSDFVKEYRNLSADDKAELATYAQQEADILGIELAAKAA